MMKPDPNWLETLPADRLLTELSLWSADLGRLADEIARVDHRADLYHVDVADGHFSPGLLFFPDLVAAVRKLTAKPLHVHLMVADAVLHEQIRRFADVGADVVSVHAENGDVHGALALLAGLGVRSGLVLQLHTPVAEADPHLDQLAILTLLGTRIGVKGQGLDALAESRLGQARALVAARRSSLSSRRVLLAADGGIREGTVPRLRRAGAETVVMGSLAFDAADFEGRMAWVHAQPTGG